MALNLDEILAQFSIEQPTGEDLRHDAAYMQLEKDIQGKPEQQKGNEIIPAEAPNWRQIKQQSEELLRRSVDLHLLSHYLRALAAVDGFSGLAAGLNLLNDIVHRCWDRLHPIPDPGEEHDPIERVNALAILTNRDEKSGGNAFIPQLLMIPLLYSPLGKFSYWDIGIAKGKYVSFDQDNKINQQTIDSAIASVQKDMAPLLAVYHDIERAIGYLQAIEHRLDDYLSDQAPSFSQLRNFLKEIKTFLEHANVLEASGGEEKDNVELLDEPLEDTKPSKLISNAANGGLITINSNADVIRTMDLICDYYKKNEPSSPVPLVIERAKRLVGKNFMDVLNEITPNAIDDALRIFGRSAEDQS